MDVNGANNLREKVKTEKDVKPERGVGGEKKEYNVKQIRSKSGEGKFQRDFFLSQKMGRMKTSKVSTASGA